MRAQRPPPLAGCQASGGLGPAGGSGPAETLPSFHALALRHPVCTGPQLPSGRALRMLLSTSAGCCLLGAGRAGHAHPVPTACHCPSPRLGEWPAQHCHLAYLCVSVCAESECAHMCECMHTCGWQVSMSLDGAGWPWFHPVLAWRTSARHIFINIFGGQRNGRGC